MKKALQKYKIPLISSGILLSIIVSVPIINANFSKEDLTKSQIELKAATINEIENKKEEVVEIKDAVDNEKDVDSENEKIKSEDVKEDANVNNTKDVDVKKESDLKVNNKPSIDKKEDSNKNNAKAQTPITTEKYTVQKGDTLSVIAKRANTNISHLKHMNNLSSDTIYENQILNIKGNISNAEDQLANRGNERSEDLYWLSRIIHSEAQGESYEGKVAVGNVIINRVKSSKFPNTIKGVVFDKQEGYTQFSPVIYGTIYNTPSAESIKAAKDVLNGARPVGDGLYFLNPSKSTNFWIVQNRKYMKTIGLHDFYY